MELAEMSPTVTTFADAKVRIMMLKVDFAELLGGVGKIILILEAEWFGVFLFPF